MSAAPTVSAGPDGSGGLLSVRRATEGDRQALTRMLARCSGDTRYRRFHGPVKAFPEPYLTEALAGGPVHVALIASAPAEPAADAGTAADGDAVVALASCRMVAEGAAELGLLVEDGWQQRGIGGRLLRELVDVAARIGLRVLQAQLLAEQAWILGLLRRYGQCTTVATGGLLTVTVRLPRPGELPARRGIDPFPGTCQPLSAPPPDRNGIRPLTMAALPRQPRCRYPARVWGGRVAIIGCPLWGHSHRKDTQSRNRQPGPHGHAGSMSGYK